MKILVVCQHYWPEPYPLADVCEELVRRGHQVQVITGVPNYPLGRIYPGYEKGKNREQILHGVRIHRSFTIGRRSSLLFRFFNYFSYAISSTVCACRIREEFDVVFAYQTSPVMMAGAALAYGRKYRKKVVLYCMDLWPASLEAGGIKEGTLIYRLFGRLSRRIYQGADRILISSEGFREYLRENFGIRDEKIVYHPQYAQLPHRMGVPVKKDTVDLVFAGNIGAAQSIPTILKAAGLLRQNTRLRWHIAGDGSELDHCRELARQWELENVIFHGRRSLQQMGAIYAMADAMLVTLTAQPYIARTLPGKMLSCMAAGKPIIGAADGPIAAVIADSGCGFCAGAEDAAGLAAAVEGFLDCPDKKKLGENARAYYLTHFSRGRFFDALERELEEQAL